jgi:hypothetical protein
MKLAIYNKKLLKDNNKLILSNATFDPACADADADKYKFDVNRLYVIDDFNDKYKFSGKFEDGKVVGGVLSKENTTDLQFDKEQFTTASYHPFVRLYFHLSLIMEGLVRLDKIVDVNYKIGGQYKFDSSRMSETIAKKSQMDLTENEALLQSFNKVNHANRVNMYKNKFIIISICIVIFFILFLYALSTNLPFLNDYLKHYLLIGICLIIIMGILLNEFLNSSNIKEFFDDDTNYLTDIDNLKITENVFKHLSLKLVGHKNEPAAADDVLDTNFKNYRMFIHETAYLNTNENLFTFKEDNTLDDTKLPFIMFSKYESSPSITHGNYNCYGVLANLFLNKFFAPATPPDVRIDTQNNLYNRIKEIYTNIKNDYLQLFFNIEQNKYDNMYINGYITNKNKASLEKYKQRLSEIDLYNYYINIYYAKIMIVILCVIIMMIIAYQNSYISDINVLLISGISVIIVLVIFLYIKLSAYNKKVYTYKDTLHSKPQTEISKDYILQIKQ